MADENMVNDLELKNIDEKRNYFIKETDQNKLINNRHKKVSMTINYIEHFPILTSRVTWYS